MQRLVLYGPMLQIWTDYGKRNAAQQVARLRNFARLDDFPQLPSPSAHCAQQKGEGRMTGNE